MGVLLVGDFMTRFPRAIRADETLAQAHQLMRAHQIRHLPVLAGTRLVGVVSMGDLHLLETLKGVDASQVTVEEAMTRDPYTVNRATELRVATRHMWKHKLGSAVVVEDEAVVGVFTVSDALEALTQLLER